MQSFETLFEWIFQISMQCCVLRSEEVEKVLIYDLENKHINLCLEAVGYYPISEGNQQLPFEEVIESSWTFFNSIDVLSL